MKRFPIYCLALFFLIQSAFGDESFGELIFQDDFERSESQDEKDEPGNGWTTSIRKYRVISGSLR